MNKFTEPYKHRPYKDYIDEQETLIMKVSDTNEVKDLKNKIKTIMIKLSTTKKQKETLQKQNQSLHEEVINLQNNLRQMVSGFSNTSCNFPINNELSSQIAQFYKCDCLDIFFDILCPSELSMKGIIYFYYQAFHKANDVIDRYLQPAYHAIQSIGCLATIEGPIINVLRKSFQSTYTKILQKIHQMQQLPIIIQEILSKLGIQQQDNMIMKFMSKLLELLLCCKISDPPLHLQLTSMGKKIKYNALKNDLLDGFINNKDECWVVLPEVKKYDQNGQCFTKSIVLKVDYDLVN